MVEKSDGTARKRITKRAVDAMRQGKKDVFLWDGELRGFGVRVTPGGARSFVLKYAAPGRHGISRRITIGRYGPMTVDQARDVAISNMSKIAKGKDPAAERSEQRRAAKEETVEKLFDAYWDYGLARFKLRTMEEWQRIYKLHIGPSLGSVPVAAVTRRDIAHLHNDLRSTPVMANRTVQLLKAFYFWMERSGTYPGPNPARGIELFEERGRERFLNVEELSRLGLALRVAETVGLPPAPEHRYRSKRTTKRNGEYASQIEPANPFAVGAVRFILFTGMREQEALTLKWADVDFSRGLATLPDTKSGKSARALGAPALNLLDSMKKMKVRGNPYIFVGQKDGSPLEGVRRLWHAARHEAGLPDVRLHDLRHTTASFAGGSGFSLFLIGKLLGHKTARSTERYAHLADDARRTMADVVAGAIRSALDEGVADGPEKVVPLHHVKRA